MKLPLQLEAWARRELAKQPPTPRQVAAKPIPAQPIPAPRPAPKPTLQPNTAAFAREAQRHEFAAAKARRARYSGCTNWPPPMRGRKRAQK